MSTSFAGHAASPEQLAQQGTALSVCSRRLPRRICSSLRVLDRSLHWRRVATARLNVIVGTHESGWERALLVFHLQNGTYRQIAIAPLTDFFPLRIKRFCGVSFSLHNHSPGLITPPKWASFSPPPSKIENSENRCCAFLVIETLRSDAWFTRLGK